MLVPMRIPSTRVFIRDRVEADFSYEAVFMLDWEAVKLNPLVGEFEGVRFYTVCELSGRPIGVISTYNYTGTDTELGIQIHREENRNRGYGTEALSAFIDWMFAISGIDFVHLKVVVENVRAIKCYEKVGFSVHSEGELDGYWMVYMRRYRKKGGGPDDTKTR